MISACSWKIFERQNEIRLNIGGKKNQFRFFQLNERKSLSSTLMTGRATDKDWLLSEQVYFQSPDEIPCSKRSCDPLCNSCLTASLHRPECFLNRGKMVITDRCICSYPPKKKFWARDNEIGVRGKHPILEKNAKLSLLREQNKKEIATTPWDGIERGKWAKMINSIFNF